MTNRINNYDIQKSSVSDNTASDEIATKDQCNICNSSVKAGDKGIMCESCKLWFHVKCVGINLKLYDLLQLEGAKQICFPKDYKGLWLAQR